MSGDKTRMTYDRYRDKKITSGMVSKEWCATIHFDWKQLPLLLISSLAR